MKSKQELITTLKRLDRQSYSAYKTIKGRYKFPSFTLIIDRVQGDPFASPSNIRIIIPQNTAKIPPQFYKNSIRSIATADYLHRQIAKKTRHFSNDRGSGKSGLISIAPISQEVLLRSTVSINKEEIEVRLMVGLPAQGRRILGYQAQELLCEDIPLIVEKCLLFSAIDERSLQSHVETIEDGEYIRQQLPEKNLISFIANGSVLPRQSGISSLPLQGKDVVKFQSPSSLQVSFECPNRGTIEGMGVPTGITLIVGGGYHGKSTLLHAIERGIYNHPPKDGREFVVTNHQAVKIQAEEGRSVVGVDIAPFIQNLPQNKSTTNFSTPNASGSTSQSANIVEALEVGSEALLIDEDTSATNFMIRDGRMQKLISKDKEPITPFVDKIQSLYDDYGVSTVLVMGGSGDYFEVADCVIAMDSFQAIDVTEEAKKIASEYSGQRQREGSDRFGSINSRVVKPKSIDASKGKRSVKLQVRGLDNISIGRENIDVSGCKQLVESAQLRTIAYALVYAQEKYLHSQKSLAEVLDLVSKDIEKQGLDVLSHFPQSDLAYVRSIEIAMTLNRLRTLQINSKG